ncbi:MAG: cache domain-containing protein, partial [Deltaproteobacteria bacterium]|nr:cache domain-containing protein [Deltaproteobacteria bacterium]
MRASDWSIRKKLLAGFSLSLSLAVAVTGMAGGLILRAQRVFLTESKMASELHASRETFKNEVERLRQLIAAHSIRRQVFVSVATRDASVLPVVMGQILTTAKLDFVTVTDTEGRVFFRAGNPLVSGDSMADDLLVAKALRERVAAAEARRVSPALLGREAPDLPERAVIEAEGKVVETDGLVLMAAAPVFTPDGKFEGVLYGGALLNRTTALVDRMRRIVDDTGTANDHSWSSATLCLGEVRVATDYESSARLLGSRLDTGLSAHVLEAGREWHGRALEQGEWFVSGASPIRNLSGAVIGALYVGVPERRFSESPAYYLVVFLAIVSVVLVLGNGLALFLSRRIANPIQTMAKAVQQVASGDFSQRVSITSRDELGHLAECLNSMTTELAHSRTICEAWAHHLEKTVEERTAELAEAHRRLFKSEKLAAVGRLAAGVAHEINNPMTCILLNGTQLLREMPAEGSQRKELQCIVDESLRCRKIVSGLLDFSRQRDPQFVPVNLQEVVERVLALVRNHGSFKGIGVETRLAESPLVLLADRDQLEQVLLNIILNASEAMAGSGTLEITANEIGDAGEVEIRVADTGP